MISIFKLRFSHDYFGSTFTLPVGILPTEETARRADRAGIRLLDSSDGVAGYCEQEGFEVLGAHARDRVEPLVLVFLVRPLDPRFVNYTQGPELSPGHLSLITEVDLEQGPCDGAGTPFKLKDALARGMVKEGDLIPPPLLVLRLDFSGEGGLSRIEGAAKGSPLQGDVAWKNRKTHWRYFIPVEEDGEGLMIEDIQGQVGFSHCPGVFLNGFRQYQGFISDGPLPLAHGASGRFQLKQRDQGRCRILIRALPNASADRLQGMTKGEDRIFVSDIFVHHYIHRR